MYIRKDIAKLLEKMPNEMKIPRHWKKFVNKQSIKYNLIIKHGKEYECTNCGKYFSTNEIEKQKAKCPFCKNIYEVRRSNLKNYFFLYDLAIVDNVDNRVIIRYFENRRDYNYKTKRFTDDLVEYARIIPELDVKLANDRYSKFLSSEKIYHTKRIRKWRIYRGEYGLVQYYDAIYLDNINEKLKGTKYEYSQIKEAIEYIGNYKVDLLNILKKANNPSFELLMKSNLYNLALECSEKFNITGNFEKRFGISKEYYNFMKKHNITYDELQVLKLINIQDIEKIKCLLKIADNNIKDLETVSKYVNLIKLEEYSKNQQNFMVNIYLDYIENLEKLNIPLNKKILFPENFHVAHNDIMYKVDVIENKETHNKIKKRFKQLKINEFSDGNFFIRPASSLNDMRDEANQQENCVYQNYSEKYANKKTDIYFLRKVNEPNLSLVTVEVLNNKIRQKYQKKNKLVTEEQSDFLKLWEEKVLQKAA